MHQERLDSSVHPPLPLQAASAQAVLRQGLRGRQVRAGVEAPGPARPVVQQLAAVPQEAVRPAGRALCRDWRNQDTARADRFRAASVPAAPIAAPPEHAHAASAMAALRRLQEVK